jgi:CRP/FNR family cyclic AMP-dependent transcriptional regulator
VNVRLFDHAETTSIAAGTTIFKAGDSGDVMYVIIEGEIEIRVGAVMVEIAGQGSIVGEMALIDKAPRSASAKARTDCKVAVVDLKRFEFLVQNTPFFAVQVMRIMAHRLRHSNIHLETEHAESASAV